MVKTRRQNAKSDANPSKTVFSKEQNDFKIKQVQEYSLHATGQYSLNLFVTGLNDSSTEAEIKKAYYYMTSIFHPDKNIGLDTTEMMKMMFSYSETLEILLVEYTATEIGFLDDYLDADPNHKSIRGNGITTFILHVSQMYNFQ